MRDPQSQKRPSVRTDRLNLSTAARNTTDMLEPHPLAALFPELLPEELAQLARDIKERGQLESIILYKGQILDGLNRYKACQLAGVNPRTEEFGATSLRT